MSLIEDAIESVSSGIRATMLSLEKERIGAGPERDEKALAIIICLANVVASLDEPFFVKSAEVAFLAKKHDISTRAALDSFNKH